MNQPEIENDVREMAPEPDPKTREFMAEHESRPTSAFQVSFYL